MKPLVLDHGCYDQWIRNENEEAEKCPKTQNTNKRWPCPLICCVSVCLIIKEVHVLIIVAFIHPGLQTLHPRKGKKKKLRLTTGPIAWITLTNSFLLGAKEGLWEGIYLQASRKNILIVQFSAGDICPPKDCSAWCFDELGIFQSLPCLQAPSSPLALTVTLRRQQRGS